MKRKNHLKTHSENQRGFSFLELVAATAIFIVLAGIIFSVLVQGQQRYETESGVMDSFQQASIAVDQIVRDVHSAGYPPTNAFTAAVAAANPNLIALPFGWTPSYPGTPCTIGGTCVITPSGFDLIVEADIGNGNGVEWIRYQLNGTTLMRGMAPKAVGADPAATTLPTLVPYVNNVMNNAPAAQMAQLRAVYPNLFPGNNPVPIFTYTCDAPNPNPPALCTTLATPNNTATYIRGVNIVLIVQSPTRDQKTGQLRAVTLTAQAARSNPNS
jgi:type II secretory pathway pseudopilin PulG